MSFSSLQVSNLNKKGTFPNKITKQKLLGAKFSKRLSPFGYRIHLLILYTYEKILPRITLLNQAGYSSKLRFVNNQNLFPSLWYNFSDGKSTYLKWNPLDGIKLIKRICSARTPSSRRGLERDTTRHVHHLYLKSHHGLLIRSGSG